MTKLIEANTTIPSKKSEVFSTASDNQPSVEIHILQGERPMANQNRTIGRFHLDGIPPSPRGIPQIEVTFDIDANGILHVGAKDKATGKEQKIRIEASSGLTDEEIKRMKDEAEANAESDKQAREEVEKLNAADALIFSTEKQLKEYGDKLSGDKKTPIEEGLKKLKDAHASKDFAAIDTAQTELQAAWNVASEDMYKASQEAGAGQEGQPQGEASGQDAGDHVTDVDFEEVKEDEKK
jgi:molecular chaperone DnaK